MERGDYRRLGDCVREVDVRNAGSCYNTLMGISIDKYFMPSVANVIGTDLTKYKVVKDNQFACNLMHAGRDERIPMALLKGGTVIVSPAYHVFEILDTDVLMPEFLDMVLKRPDFDREAKFHTDGDVRGGISFDELLNIQIPVPSAEEQRIKVSQYQALENRLSVDRKLIDKLEDALLSIYSNLCVEDIEYDNLPTGWRMGLFGDLIESTFGGDWGKDEQIDNYTSETICLRGADINGARRGQLDKAPRRFILPKNLASKRLTENTIVMELSGGTPTQSTGRAVLITDTILETSHLPFICSNFCRVLRPKKDYELYLYITILHLYRKGVFFTYENSSNGIQNLDLDAICKEEVMPIPSSADLATFNQQARSINEYIICLGKEIEKLEAAKEKFVTVL